MNLHFELDSRVYTNLDGEMESERHRLDLFGLRTSAATEAYLFVADNYERLSAPVHDRSRRRDPARRVPRSTTWACAT